jgi:hypothetical protein
MADVHQIEAAVGEYDPLFLRAALGEEVDQLIPGLDLVVHGPIVPWTIPEFLAKQPCSLMIEWSDALARREQLSVFSFRFSVS